MLFVFGFDIWWWPANTRCSLKMSLEYNFARMCRTCLMENCHTKSVFSYEECLDPATSLRDIIMTCASVQGDGLPEQVCLTCANEINRAFLFRKLCEKSDTTLRHYVNNVVAPLRDNQQNYTSYISSDSKGMTDETEEKSTVFVPKIELLESELQDVMDQNDSSEVSDEDLKKGRKVRKKNRLTPGDGFKTRKLYKCKTCNENCAGLGNYRKHVMEVHSEKLHKCDACSKRFTTSAQLDRHKALHLTSTGKSNSDDKQKPLTKKHKTKTGIIKQRNLPRTCTICNKTFRFHSNLERHKLIHTGEKPYLCNVCGKGFAQLSYLKIHSFIHTGEKPYKCNMCERSFAAPGTLMTHIRTHTGERPHVCKICGKDFPQSGYLSAHIRTHTGEKPVECKVCHRRFNQSGRLIIHMRIHSGEKPYTCTECGRSFAVKGTLKKHIRTHTGERPYICNVCGQAFAQSGTLATHMKVHKAK